MSWSEQHRSRPPPGRVIAVLNADSELLRRQVLALAPNEPIVQLRRRRTGIVDGALGYFDELSVRANLLLGSPTRWRARTDELEELCRRFGVFDQLAKRGLDRSLREVICLVRALHLSHEVLVVDGVVDDLSGHDWDAFIELSHDRSAAGKTTIFSLHSMRFKRVSRADEILIYRGERLVFRGPPADVGAIRGRLLLSPEPDAVARDLEQRLRASLSDAGSDDEFMSPISEVLGVVFGNRAHAISLDRLAGTPLVNVSAVEQNDADLLKDIVASRPDESGESDSAPPTRRVTLTVGGIERADLGEIAYIDHTSGDPMALDADRLAEVIGRAVDDYYERQRSVQVSKDLSRAEAVRSLVGGIAHDFNNALQAMYGSADLIAHYNEDARLDRIVQTLRLVTQDAQVFVSKLLAFSRVADLRIEQIDMHAVVRDAVSMAERGAQKPVTITLNLAAERTAVFGDSSELRNVFVNLLLNSIRAVPEEGAVIDVASSVIPGPNDDKVDEGTIRVTVSDNGTGIPSELVDHIFLPFITTRDRSLGTGLGLAVARAIMHEHRGEVALGRSGPDGTTMSVTMPLAPGLLVPGDDARYGDPVAEVGAKDSLTVLVCDDDLAVLDVVAQLLTAIGHQGIVADGGHRALEIVRERHADIDVCVVDQLMPDMNGDELIGHIRSIRRDMPCISLSGFRADELTRRPSKPERDPDLWLTKPIGMREFAEALTSVVSSRPLSPRLDS